MPISKSIPPAPLPAPAYWVLSKFEYCNVSCTISAVLLGYESKDAKDAGAAQLEMRQISLSGVDVDDVMGAAAPVDEIYIKVLGLPEFSGGSVVE